MECKYIIIVEKVLKISIQYKSEKVFNRDFTNHHHNIGSLGDTRYNINIFQFIEYLHKSWYMVCKRKGT